MQSTQSAIAETEITRQTRALLGMLTRRDKGTTTATKPVQPINMRCQNDSCLSLYFSSRSFTCCITACICVFAIVLPLIPFGCVNRFCDTRINGLPSFSVNTIKLEHALKFVVAPSESGEYNPQCRCVRQYLF